MLFTYKGWNSGFYKTPRIHIQKKKHDLWFTSKSETFLKLLARPPVCTHPTQPFNQHEHNLHPKTKITCLIWFDSMFYCIVCVVRVRRKLHASAVKTWRMARTACRSVLAPNIQMTAASVRIAMRTVRATDAPDHSTVSDTEPAMHVTLLSMIRIITRRCVFRWTRSVKMATLNTFIWHPSMDRWLVKRLAFIFYIRLHLSIFVLVSACTFLILALRAVVFIRIHPIHFILSKFGFVTLVGWVSRVYLGCSRFGLSVS